MNNKLCLYLENRTKFKRKEYCVSTRERKRENSIAALFKCEIKNKEATNSQVKSEKIN